MDSNKPISIDIIENVDDYQKKYYFSYKQDDVSDLPKFMNEMFQSSDYYTTGIRKDNQFLESILYSIDKEYKLLSLSDKNIKVEKLLLDLFENIEKYYKTFNYKSKGINKKELIDDVISKII